MPTAILEKQQLEFDADNNNVLPSVLHTPSGLALIEIQGKIHIGNRPLIQSALDLQHLTDEDTEDQCSIDSGQQKKLGTVEFLDNGKDVCLVIGKHQRLRGKISELKTPLAVLKLNAGDETGSAEQQGDGDIRTIPILEVIKYKILFNLRPEPVV